MSNLKISKNALAILEKRYFIKNEKEEVQEDAEGMFRRVAKAIALVEKNYNKKEEEIIKIENDFYEIMSNLEFLPNSPTLMNAGTSNQQLSACFVLPVEDSMESIFTTIKNTSLVHQSAGGTGFNFSHIRPKNDKVKTTGGVASGPISFMKVFDAATEAVKQGGKRRGANIGILNCYHPDIIEFIKCKNEDKVISNFNISVMIEDKFMKAVENNRNYDLINPKTNIVNKTIKAKEIFNLIVEQAWKNGEPGILFYDRINKDNPTPDIAPIEATNPCIIGSTLIATADGRNAVSIKQLTEEGKDIPVYCYGDNKIEVSMARNPRKTREKAEVWKVELDDGSIIIATPDHKFRRRNNTEVMLKDLKQLDSLMPFNYDNHKVKSISFYGYEDVYNLTVDKYNNYAIITSNNDNAFIKSSGICISNCGEIPLSSYGACNLGSINLTKIIKDGKIDWNKFEKLIILSVRFLDNVVDACKFPLPEIEKKVKEERKIGLGVMGFADMLIMLGIKYNSKDSYKLASKLVQFLREIADSASRQLAKEKGDFPVIKKSIYKNTSMRNATRLTIAPTGTLSIIAGCSSSIEPTFSVCYVRTIMDGQKFIEVNPFFEGSLKNAGVYSDKLLEKVSTKASIQEIEEIPKEIRDIYVTAHDVLPEEHVKIQSIFQEYIDNSISKTCNLPNSATKEDVEKIIFQAWNDGCKGITVYRDGSREAQVLSIKGSTEVKKDEFVFKEKYRPDEYAYGKTHQFKTAQCGKILLTVNGDSKESIRELICTVGQSGDCITSHQEALFKMASHLLRYGIPLKVVIKSLKGIGCPKPTFWKEYNCSSSCLDVMARKIEEYAKEIINIKKAGHKKCPDCGASLSEGSCDKCLSCGWSSCSGG